MSVKSTNTPVEKILRNSLILVELGSYFVSSGHCLDNIALSIFSDKIWGAIMQLLSTTTTIVIIIIHPCKETAIRGKCDLLFPHISAIVVSAVLS